MHLEFHEYTLHTCACMHLCMHVHILFRRIYGCLKPPYLHIHTAGPQMFTGDLRSVGHSHWYLAVAALQRRAGVAEGGAVAGRRMAHGGPWPGA